MSKSSTTLSDSNTECKSYLDPKEAIKADSYVITVAAFDNQRIIYVEHLSDSMHSLIKYKLNDLTQNSQWSATKPKDLKQQHTIAERIEHELFDAICTTTLLLTKDMYKTFKHNLLNEEEIIVQKGEHDSAISHALQIQFIVHPFV